MAAQVDNPVLPSWQDFVDSREASVDVPEDNGFCFSGVVVPDDVLESVLSFVPIEDVLNCNLVCRAWKDLISRKSFWKLRYEWAKKQQSWNLIPAKVREKPLSWIVLYLNLVHDTFSKNLISNPSGRSGFEGWNTFRANEWVIENPPAGCDPLPNDEFFGPEDTSCFASTYFWCNKLFNIDVWHVGLNPIVMKLCLPFQIKCSIMYSARFDCRGEGRWSVGLLDAQQKLILAREARFQRNASVHWDRAEKTFDFKMSDLRFMENVRHMTFVVRGKDQQFWAGHYGMKFARACVTVQFLTSDPEAESIFIEAETQPPPEYFDFRFRYPNRDDEPMDILFEGRHEYEMDQSDEDYPNEDEDDSSDTDE